MPSSFIEAIAVPSSLSADLIATIHRPEENQRHKSCIVMGSFKFHDEINRTIEVFGSGGIHVIAPDKSPVSTSILDFPVLESDAKIISSLEKKYGKFNEHQIRALLERRFQLAIICAGFAHGFAYIVSPGGYAGQNVAGEMAMARGVRLPIYSSEPLDPDLDDYDYYLPLWKGMALEIKAYNPEQVIDMANRNAFDEEDYQWCPGFVWKWPNPTERDFRNK